MVTQHLSEAFQEVFQAYPTLHGRWVRISHKIGGGLPDSLLCHSIIRDGQFDLLIRTLEEKYIENNEDNIGIDEISIINIQYQMSQYWICGVYANLFKLKKSIIIDNYDNFDCVFDDLRILRVGIEKHEIADDRNLKQPIAMQRISSAQHSTDSYNYDPKDPKRAHIMPIGISERGSFCWQITDLKQKSSRWLERQELSDRVLDLFDPKPPNQGG